MEFVKRAAKTTADHTIDTSVTDTVKQILSDIEAEKEPKCREYCQKFDKYAGDVVLTSEAIEAACDQVPQSLKDDIKFAQSNIKRFAEAQKATITDMEVEVIPGLIAGQKNIPINVAACYVPGGRYAHIASALMTVTTAKVAGCSTIVVASPPRQGQGVHPAIIYAAHISGATTIMAMGGVQAIAAMTFGLFGLPPADILCGPGNQYVAEAKRLLYGRVGIDMFAGPTDSLIIADATADAELVAVDLVSQAEHGYNSPVWLITTSKELGEEVLKRIPNLIAQLPPTNKESAELAWRDYGEIVVVKDREAMAELSDKYAPEHLTVMAEDLDWWKEKLTCYGSLFLGAETTVTFGDKASGPNHVLPTSQAARYTGGLSVHKFMKVVTWQRSTPSAMKSIAQVSARISRSEGMEGHAMAADARLDKFFPTESFDVGKNGDE